MRFDVNDASTDILLASVDCRGSVPECEPGRCSTFERRFELSRICYVHFGTIGTSGLPLGLGQVGDELDAAG
jgi:hypothetical protein